MAAPLVLISHGNLCVELKKSVELIMGPQPDIRTVALEPKAGPAEFLAEFTQVTNDLEDFVVFADLYGGTPCNVAAKLLLGGATFKLYAGMNMAMVIDYLNAAMLEQEPDPVNGGINGICDVNAQLQQLTDDD